MVGMSFDIVNSLGADHDMVDRQQTDRRTDGQHGLQQ